MIRTILKYGAPELEARSKPVAEFDDQLGKLAKDMFETMYSAPGIGLAAPQLGLNIRLFVVDVTGGEEKGHQLVLVNPEIAEERGQQSGQEGCLSIPGFLAEVTRSAWVHVVGQDLQGDSQEVEAEGLLARAMCHEIDHLNGVLFLDRISMLKKDLIKRKIRKLARAGEW